MKRKKRYWVCDDCGKVWRRKKSDADKACWHCGKFMRRARVYPYKLVRKVGRRQTAKRRERERLTKRHSVLRTAFKSRLRVSTPTRRAWRHFLAAKQRRTFISRGQVFLDALYVDIWSCPHHRGYIKGFNRGCNCTGGGMVAVPQLHIEKLPGGLHGQYSGPMGSAKGFSITLDYDRDERVSTFIHEIVHWIDAMSGANREPYVGSHKKPFYTRMEDLAKQLKYQELVL